MVTRPPEERTDYGMFVDGEFTSGSAEERIEVEYPFDRQVWATVPDATASDVENAVGAAKRRFESAEWQRLTATERGKLLFSLADEIEKHRDELARLQTLENGKLIRAMRAQMEYLPDWYRYYGGLADKVEGRTLPADTNRMFNFTLREPYGVVGAVTPWNSPLMLATYKIAPAVAAGNTVVLKPSEVSPVSSLRLAELADEAGFPPGTLNVVPGYGDTGAALVDHDDVRKVAFTGGLETGSRVASAAGEKIAPVTLELGGKSPQIVFPDADLDNAVKGIIKGVFAANGQTCIAGSRLFLHESIHDEFVDRLVERTGELTLGDPFDDETDISSIAFEDQFEKVRRYVEIAKDEGATVEIGGEPRTDLHGGLFYPPTVLTDVTNDTTIAREEVFGPVLSVIPFEDEDGAVEMANDSEYGLASGIWTNDIRRSARLWEALDAGVVWVNTYRNSSFTTPFGGHKKSGVGVEKGKQAIEEYLQTKSVWIEREGTVSDPFKIN